MIEKHVFVCDWCRKEGPIMGGGAFGLPEGWLRLTVECRMKPDEVLHFCHPEHAARKLFPFQNSKELRDFAESGSRG